MEDLRFPRSAWLLGILVLWGGFGRADAGAPSDRRSVLRTVAEKAPEKWKEYAAAIRCLTYKCTLDLQSRSLDVKTGKWDVKRDVTYSITVHQDLAKSRRLMTMAEDGGGLGQYVANEQYHFTAGIESKLDQYRLYSGDRGRDVHSHFEDDVDRVLSAPISVLSTPLQAILDGKFFRNVSAAIPDKGADAASNVIRLEFLYTVGDSSPAFPVASPGSTYWVHLDPTSWLAVSGGIRDSRGSTRTSDSFSVKYDAQIQGQPFPSEVRFAVEVEDDDSPTSVSERLFTLRDPAACDDSSDRYFLAHYGISEETVDFLNPKTSYRLVAFWFGIVGLIVALLGMRFLSRSSGSNST